MKKFKILLALMSLAFSSYVIASETLKLVPYPEKINITEGYCDLASGISVSDKSSVAGQLLDYFSSDFNIPANKKGVKVKFVTSGKIVDEEAYTLQVNKKVILITAATPKGHFYGVQTLRQLVKDRKVPCLLISDTPAFAWRAFMLDEARHFHGKATVKRMLDEMALLKMNTFHWHLTDDAGWRVEIKKYPLLTEIGSKRDSTQIEDKELKTPGETGNAAYDAFLRRYQSNKFDPKPHTGFYTQEDIREIVAYAADRCIQIVPEISMPGHASAAIASYPWLGTTKEKIKVPVRFGVLSQVYDPSSSEVMTFLKDVLTEISQLFPSGYIHIGGDEVKYVQWEQSPSVQRYMKENKLETCRDLQVKMTNDMCHFIETSLGKEMIGWNEILGLNVHGWSENKASSTEKLSKKAVVQFWSGNKDILKYALDNGYKVVNSYCEDTYIDYSYEQVSLERAYKFNPVPEGYDRTQIYGIGCQLWTEWVRDAKMVEYQAFPRIAAYAETGWSKPENKSYERFLKCIAPLLDRWKKKGYNLPECIL